MKRSGTKESGKGGSVWVGARDGWVRIGERGDDDTYRYPFQERAFYIASTSNPELVSEFEFKRFNASNSNPYT